MLSGILIELVYPFRQMLFLYIFGTIVGCVASILTNPVNYIGIGALTAGFSYDVATFGFLLMVNNFSIQLPIDIDILLIICAFSFLSKELEAYGLEKFDSFYSRLFNNGVFTRYALSK